METQQQIAQYLTDVFQMQLAKTTGLTNGQKQLIMQMFNQNLSVNCNYLIQRQQQNNGLLSMSDYNGFAQQLLNQYYQSAMAAGTGYPQMGYQQPMFGNGYGQPMYGQPMYPPQQPMYGQPMYPQQPAQIYYGSQMGGMAAPQYSPPIMPAEQNPYKGTLGGSAAPVYTAPNQPRPANVVYGSQMAPQQQPVAPAQPQPLPKPTYVVPQQAPQPAPMPQTVLQAVESDYPVPTITARNEFSLKTPISVKGSILTFQRMDGTTFKAVRASSDTPLKNPELTARELLDKYMAVDVSLMFHKHTLIPGNLAEMQKSSQAIKKLIESDKTTSEIITGIINHINPKAKALSNFVEKTIVDAYNKYVTTVGADVLPKVAGLNDLVNPSCTQMDRYIRKALQLFYETCVYDPASSQLASFLKDVDTLTDKSYSDLKKHKDEFQKWAKSHCVIKHPAELFRLTTLKAGYSETDDFTFDESTNPDDDIEFLTMDAVREFSADQVVMWFVNKNQVNTFSGTADKNPNLKVAFV